MVARGWARSVAVFSRSGAGWLGAGLIVAGAAACGHTQKARPGENANVGGDASHNGGSFVDPGGAYNAPGAGTGGETGGMASSGSGMGGAAAGVGGVQDPCTALKPYEPLFVADPSHDPPPILTKTANGHLVFRGAGRLRMRHEMEPEYATFPPYYFENRTFSYELDDGVAAGDGTITVTFLPNANQYYSAQGVNQEGGADLNLRFFKVYGHADGNAFAGNVGGAAKDVLPLDCAEPKTCSPRKYQYVIQDNPREQRSLQVGDQLQVEFGTFLARYSLDGSKGPPVDTGHVRNVTPLPPGCNANDAPYNNACYTQAQYFSDSFRYVVGRGTLTPYNEDCTITVPAGSDVSPNGGCDFDGPIAQAVIAGKLKDRLGPAEAGWSGGIATLPYLRFRFDLYYSQMAPNILGENVDAFVKGRRLSRLQFDVGHDDESFNNVSDAEMAPYRNLAGPRFNQLSCVGCHIANNRGMAPDAGKQLETLVVELAGAKPGEHGELTGDSAYGLRLEQHAVAGTTAEGSASLSYDTLRGQLSDGTPYNVRRPSLVLADAPGGMPAHHSVRAARPLIGLGLLEAIPETDLVALADPEDCNKDGISGVANVVWDPEDGKQHLGRFGWKASRASIRHQIARDLVLDMGVTNSVFSLPDCGANQKDCAASKPASPELSDTDLNRLVSYVRTLAVPPRRDINDAQVVHGRDVFAQIGCGTCHSPNQHTGSDHPFLELRDQVIHPFTDLLLHDMGPDLTDDMPNEFSASASEWRTPPLWGIGLCDDVAAGHQQEGINLNPSPNQGACNYLHDGRAQTLLEAILWHGGESKASRDKVVAMGAGDRLALVAFLKSL